MYLTSLTVSVALLGSLTIANVLGQRNDKDEGVYQNLHLTAPSSGTASTTKLQVRVAESSFTGVPYVSLRHRTPVTVTSAPKTTSGSAVLSAITDAPQNAPNVVHTEETDAGGLIVPRSVVTFGGDVCIPVTKGLNNETWRSYEGIGGHNVTMPPVGRYQYPFLTNTIGTYTTINGTNTVINTYYDILTIFGGAHQADKWPYAKSPKVNAAPFTRSVPTLAWAILVFWTLFSLADAYHYTNTYSEHWEVGKVEMSKTNSPPPLSTWLTTDVFVKYATGHFIKGMTTITYTGFASHWTDDTLHSITTTVWESATALKGSRTAYSTIAATDHARQAQMTSAGFVAIANDASGRRIVFSRLTLLIAAFWLMVVSADALGSEHYSSATADVVIRTESPAPWTPTPSYPEDTEPWHMPDSAVDDFGARTLTSTTTTSISPTTTQTIIVDASGNIKAEYQKSEAERKEAQVEMICKTVIPLGSLAVVALIGIVVL